MSNPEQGEERTGADKDRPVGDTARAVLSESAYAAVGLGDAVAEAVRGLPPLAQTLRTVRGWGARRVHTVSEEVERGFDNLVRRGRRTLGSAPLDSRPLRRRPAPATEVADVAPPDMRGYEVMTIAQLRAEARRRNLPGRAHLHKDELVAALRSDDAGSA